MEELKLKVDVPKGPSSVCVLIFYHCLKNQNLKKTEQKQIIKSLSGTFFVVLPIFLLNWLSIFLCFTMFDLILEILFSPFIL